QEVRFVGNKTIKDGELRPGLALTRVKQRGTALDPYLVATDGERVKGIYLRHGYFYVVVQSRVERNGAAATVIYQIEEGPRSKTRAGVTGAPEDPTLATGEGRKKLPLRDDEPFEYAPYEQAKEPLLAVVQDAGYAHARLDARVVADRANL